ncbi:hypothetical protein [Vitreimonas flagellata]|uniref:hypothetical protein n=1 Tax=Vitreimonas flagellata TaxID=2560861 RepID=UPI0014320FD4|nr:hypothetical protein [Vitreimonas flagellata]
MTLPESAIGAETAFAWKTYGVSRRDKEPLLKFVVDALSMRGCKVLAATDPTSAILHRF